jgi:hypothetical protein
LVSARLYSQRIVISEHETSHLPPLVSEPAIERPIHVVFPNIDRHAERGTEVAADRIDILILAVIDALAIIGNPGRQTVGMPLVARGKGGIALKRLIITAQQRHRAAERLEIVAAAARGATVDEQAGMSPAQFIPKSQVSLDVPVLGESLAVGRIIGAPELERVHIEILAVEIDSLLADKAVHVIGKPLVGRGISQVEQLATQEPLGVMRREPSSPLDSLGFEPHNEFHIPGMDIIADGF